MAGSQERRLAISHQAAPPPPTTTATMTTITTMSAVDVPDDEAGSLVEVVDCRTVVLEDDPAGLVVAGEVVTVVDAETVDPVPPAVVVVVALAVVVVVGAAVVVVALAVVVVGLAVVVVGLAVVPVGLAVVVVGLAVVVVGLAVVVVASTWHPGLPWPAGGLHVLPGWETAGPANTQERMPIAAATANAVPTRRNHERKGLFLISKPPLPRTSIPIARGMFWYGAYRGIYTVVR
jgi:hypothetical protein